MITKDLGIATAYGYALSKGYTGTEEEFATLMASYASTAQTAVEAAERAVAAQGAAETAEDDAAKWATGGTSGTPGASNNAKYYSEQASGSATTASDKAGEASGSASSASQNSLKAEGYAVGKQNGTDVGSGSTYYHANAKYYKEQAAQSATDASDAKTAAQTAQGKAEDAQTAAETAQGKAEDAQEAAEAVAQSIPADYSELSADVGNLKSALNTDDIITWNQMSSRFTRASGNLAGVTYTKSVDEKQATFNGTPTTIDFFQLIQSGIGTSIIGHKYAIFTPQVSGAATGYWFFYLYSRNVRDTGNGAIWEATTATNIVVGIEWNTANLLPTFDNLTVNLPIITDLTACFGAGNEPTIEEFRTMFPNDSYPKDTGTQRALTRCEKNSSDIYHNTFALAKTQSSVKLKILTFNCGHYNYGSSSERSWTGDELAEKIKLWKDMLAKYKPDIMFGQEMSTNFDAAQTVNAIDTIFKPLLPNYYFYAWTRLLSKYAYQREWQEDVTVTVGGTTYARSFGTAKINVNGVDIIICSAHLPAGYTATDTSVREAMRDKLITAFSNYPYVIIGGDFNESTDSFYTPFVNAGYSLANHGYFGTITTLPNESVDNIIVKGFTFYDAVSDSSDACTSDHYPFASEIHIV